MPPLNFFRNLTTLVGKDQPAIFFVFEIAEFTELLDHRGDGCLADFERRCDVHDACIAFFLDQLVYAFQVIFGALTRLVARRHGERLTRFRKACKDCSWVALNFPALAPPMIFDKLERRMFRKFRLSIFVGGTCVIASCGRHEEKAVSSPATNTIASVHSNSSLPVRVLKKIAQPSTQTFFVRGVVRELKPAEKTIIIKHENIPGYMEAMIMPFEVRDTNELRGLRPGEAISFRLVVATNDAWIDQVKKLNVAPLELPSRPTVRIVRDVEPLRIGDALPEYHFTNELGQAVSTKQFKGQAIAITFFFTRCPFPTMCPRMSSNFAEVQKKLSTMANAPMNWHLLMISFDTETDTPRILKSYAERYEYDPKRWSFLTGDLLEVTAIADQFELQFWRLSPNEPLSHNLRTAVIDAEGRVQKILPENKWTSDELVQEILKAAKRNEPRQF